MRRFFSTTIASATANSKIHFSNGEAIFFPWRNRPLKSSGNQINFWITRFFIDLTQTEQEFLNGSKTVFDRAVESIFRNRALMDHNLSLIKTGPLPSEFEENVPPLSETLEPRLSEFYTNAIKNVTLQRDYVIHHEILSIQQPRIVHTDILLYSEVDKVEHEFLTRHNLLNGAIGCLKPQQEKRIEKSKNIDEQFSNIITNLKSNGKDGSSEYDTLLLRVWVDIPCEELFYVKDVAKDFLVQGSGEAQRNTHQILLENSLKIETLIQNGPSRIDNYEWKLVDIDQWMEQNDDWLEYRFQK